MADRPVNLPPISTSGTPISSVDQPATFANGTAALPSITGQNIAAGGIGVSGVSPAGVGVYGKGGTLAAQFDGNLKINGSASVSGDITLTGGDCAEEFRASSEAEPGTVMVIGEGGVIGPNKCAYDRKVVGVVSGAGEFRPAIILDRQLAEDGFRAPIALVGKVFCKVDAVENPIEVGDLLTTSATVGHAMRADPEHAFGAILGKALAPLPRGKGIIPILVTLQ